MFRSLLDGVVDLLFPPVCLTCGELSEAFCEACRAQIRAVARGVEPPEGLAEVRSVGYHEEALHRAVLRLKFGRKVALARPLGELLAAELVEVRETWRPDGLVPVPVHWTRAVSRGFNQAELLTRALAGWTGLPLEPCLRRVRPTPHQVGLSGARRLTNLRGAFGIVSSRPVKGRRLVLVDDVWTTGATLTECARALRKAGAAEVYALTVTHEV